MYAVLKAGIASIALGTVVVSVLPAQAADLTVPTLKGGIWNTPAQTVAGPCYLRADAGRSWRQDPSASYDGNVSGEALDNGWFGEIGGGCGSGSRGWRADVTFGLRQTADFAGNVVLPGPVTSDLTTDITSYTLMLNGYYDFGNMNGMVPYVGAGVGVAWHDMDNVRGSAGPTVQSGGTDTAFAWSLMAGVAYQLSPRAILDVGYRYIDLGSARSGSDPVLARLDIDDLTAHEIKIGLRYHLGTISTPLK